MKETVKGNNHKEVLAKKRKKMEGYVGLGIYVEDLKKVALDLALIAFCVILGQVAKSDFPDIGFAATVIGPLTIIIVSALTYYDDKKWTE